MLGHLHYRDNGRNSCRSSASASAEQRQAELKADSIPSARANSYSTSRHQHISSNMCLMPLHEVNQALACLEMELLYANATCFTEVPPEKPAVVVCIFLFAKH